MLPKLVSVTGNPPAIIRVGAGLSAYRLDPLGAPCYNVGFGTEAKIVVEIAWCRTCPSSNEPAAADPGTESRSSQSCWQKPLWWLQDDSEMSDSVRRQSLEAGSGESFWADTAGEKLRGRTGRARQSSRHLNSGKRGGGGRGGAGTQRDGDAERQRECITARATCD